MLHSVDIHVGARIRQRRVLLGLTQTKLAKSVGVTFQQIQKYESASNRIGASRLFEVAQVLDVPISYFFGDLPVSGRVSMTASRHGQRQAAISAEYKRDPSINLEASELAKAYGNIREAQIRKCIRELIRAIGSVGDQGLA
ncbi:helix-turn-helix domain-containing protein [Enhydrobacter aerosaccus]|uniref:helix-turn-helix domain-containing protein n=1 Tax=Enhydrobacter aerosaccus TaxID=225324 RepID=UPI000A2EE7B6|nr:helix-turn-helix transcriptional regulator [Enhydrobacter aerosaccus]